MRIPEYSAMLYNGQSVEIGGDDDMLPIEVIPPSEEDVDQGYMDGVTATETVELHRALSAWLGMHKRLHGQWHDDYRRRDPGGLTPAGKARKQLRVEQARAGRDDP